MSKIHFCINRIYTAMEGHSIFLKGGERSDAEVFFVTIGLTTIKISISEKSCSSAAALIRK